MVIVLYIVGIKCHLNLNVGYFSIFFLIMFGQLVLLNCYDYRAFTIIATSRRVCLVTITNIRNLSKKLKR